MDKLHIKRTVDSPEILLDYTNNIYRIIGESRPESARKFYQPVFDWFELLFNKQYFLNNIRSVELAFDLDYFNSTSAKVFFDLLTFLK